MLYWHNERAILPRKLSVHSSMSIPTTAAVGNAPTPATLTNACLQRSLFLSLENGADTRFEPVSPYPTFTKQQLDMRRKWEVLQHKQNRSMTTKSSKWSYLVKGKNTHVCPNNTAVKSLNTACDVPGALTEFSYDPGVPLYMFAPQINYTPLQETPFFNSTDLWNTFPINDTVIPVNGRYVTVANQIILNPLYTYYYMYLSIPISLSLSAYIDAFTSGTNASRIDTYVTSANLQVYYSNILVSTVSLSSANLYTMSVNVGQNLGSIQASTYVGNLTVDSTQPVYVATLPQYVYTYKLQVNLQTVVYDVNNTTISVGASNVSGLQSSSIANITGIDDLYYNNAVNCSIYSSRSVAFQPFSIVGTGVGPNSLC